METTRQQKIAKQIQKDVAEIFQKEGAPIVRGSLVTVTAVRISPDFSYAKIYVSIFPFEQSGEVMKRLEHQNWFIRRALGADTGLVRAVFRTEGFLICGLGAVAGMTLGVAATLAQQYFGLIEIPAETFLTKSYPVEFRPTDLAVVAASFAAVAALLSNITVRSMIKTDRL